MLLRSQFRLCYLMDCNLTQPQDLIDMGVTSLFLRFDSSQLTPDLYAFVQQAASMFLQNQRYVFVIDDVLLAVQLGASGIFYTNQPKPRTREILGADRFVGLQIRNIKGLEAAQSDPDVDFFGIGPVFQFGEKVATPLGAEFASKSSKELRGKPVFWMGGIQLHQVAEFDPGFADGVCVMRSLDVPNRQIEAQNFHKALARKLGPSVWSSAVQPADVTFRPVVKS
jgi:thiamine-phosphate diphosphorylase